MAILVTTIEEIRHRIRYRFGDGNISETVCSSQKLLQKLLQPPTLSGSIRFGVITTDEIPRPPNLCKPKIPVETKKARNVICSRVHRISGRDHFSWPVWWAKRFRCKPLTMLQHSPGVASLVRSTVSAYVISCSFIIVIATIMGSRYWNTVAWNTRSRANLRSTTWSLFHFCLYVFRHKACFPNSCPQAYWEVPA